MLAKAHFCNSVELQSYRWSEITPGPGDISFHRLLFWCKLKTVISWRPGNLCLFYKCSTIKACAQLVFSLTTISSVWDKNDFGYAIKFCQRQYNLLILSYRIWCSTSKKNMHTSYPATSSSLQSWLQGNPLKDLKLHVVWLPLDKSLNSISHLT